MVMDGSKILLTLKKSGPYKGLWGLPGGAIEFGETPEEALKRELIEETALVGAELELLCVATNFGEVDYHGERVEFHHIGIIYKVRNALLNPNLTPEEEGRWALLADLKQEELTPFAQQILSHVNSRPLKPLFCGIDLI